ncbi:hypothetical protein CHUAL_006260 [Chamberlinius hualienensis]
MATNTFLFIMTSLMAIQLPSITGWELYDASSEMCCDGKLFNKSSGSDCCHGQSYNSSEQLCCQEGHQHRLVPFPALDVRVKDVKNTELLNCCGERVMDSRTHLCCNGNITSKVFKNSGCCGPKVFDLDRFICCGNGFLFRRSANMATKGRISQCCGNQGYDPKKFLCCDGKLHRSWSSTTAACCGRDAFDIGSQGCCGGHVYDDPFGILGCCADSTFELFTEICCDSKVYPDPMRSKACCGNNAYDPNNQTCCHGKQLSSSPLVLTKSESCCGEETFQSATHMCCNGTIVERLSERSECCGNSSYEKDSGEECCGGHTVVSGKALSHNNNINVKYCCNGQVIEATTTDKKLCC